MYGNTHIEANIQVVVFRDEYSNFIAYAPALELSSYGDSIEDAMESFNESFNIFVEDLHESGSLIEELLKLGWTIRTNPQPKFRPPSYRSKNAIEEHFKKINFMHPEIIRQTSTTKPIPV